MRNLRYLPVFFSLVILITFNCTKPTSKNIKITPKKKLFKIEEPFEKVRIPFEKILIDSAKPQALVFRNGLKLEVQPDSFVDARGNPITGPVEISSRVFRDPSEIIISGIPMAYEDNQGRINNFNSGGMFEIKAQAGGNDVFLAKGKGIEAKLNTGSSLNYDFYSLEGSRGNNESEGVSWTRLSGSDDNVPKFPKVCKFQFNEKKHPETVHLKDVKWQINTMESETDPDQRKWVFAEKWDRLKLFKFQYRNILENYVDESFLTYFNRNEENTYDYLISYKRGQARVFDWNAEPQSEILDGYGGWVSPDRKYLTYGNEKNGYFIYDVINKKHNDLGVKEFPGRFHLEGDVFVYTKDNPDKEIMDVVFYDLAAGKVHKKVSLTKYLSPWLKEGYLDLLKVNKNKVPAIYVSKSYNDRYILTQSKEGICVWDSKGQKVSEYFSAASGYFRQPLVPGFWVWMDNSRKIVFVQEKQVIVWDWQNNQHWKHAFPRVVVFPSTTAIAGKKRSVYTYGDSDYDRIEIHHPQRSEFVLTAFDNEDKPAFYIYNYQNNTIKTINHPNPLDYGTALTCYDNKSESIYIALKQKRTVKEYRFYHGLYTDDGAPIMPPKPFAAGRRDGSDIGDIHGIFFTAANSSFVEMHNNHIKLFDSSGSLVKDLSAEKPNLKISLKSKDNLLAYTHNGDVIQYNMDGEIVQKTGYNSKITYMTGERSFRAMESYLFYDERGQVLLDTLDYNREVIYSADRQKYLVTSVKYGETGYDMPDRKSEFWRVSDLAVPAGVYCILLESSNSYFFTYVRFDDADLKLINRYFDALARSKEGRRKAEQVRKRKEQEVVRTFVIFSLGIFNWDIYWKQEETRTIQVRLNITNKTEFTAASIFQIAGTDDKRVIKYPGGSDELMIVYNPLISNTFIIVLPGDIIGIIREEVFTDAVRKSEQGQTTPVLDLEYKKIEKPAELAEYI